jgi:hypothetical protein
MFHSKQAFLITGPRNNNIIRVQRILPIEGPLKHFALTINKYLVRNKVQKALTQIDQWKRLSSLCS